VVEDEELVLDDVVDDWLEVVDDDEDVEGELVEVTVELTEAEEVGVLTLLVVGVLVVLVFTARAAYPPTARIMMITTTTITITDLETACLNLLVFRVTLIPARDFRGSKNVCKISVRNRTIF
jgi:hypothetical protein